MKIKLLYILSAVIILCSCTGHEAPEEIPETPVPPEEIQVEAPPSPVFVSPLATEELLPIEDYSWEREYPAEYVMLHFTSNVVANRENPFVLSDVRKIFTDNYLSIHYIIDRDGSIYCWIPENRAAWHAGKGALANDERLTNAMNKYSIGIEMLAIGSRSDMAQYLTSYEYSALPEEFLGFTDAQYSAVSALVKDICKRNGIHFDRQHVIGHEEYNSAKSDPGELFLWEKIFKN